MLHVVGIVELGAPLVNGHILRGSGGINQSSSGVVGVRCECVFMRVCDLYSQEACSFLVPLV
jgi:hypothetical protein